MPPSEANQQLICERSFLLCTCLSPKLIACKVTAGRWYSSTLLLSEDFA